MYVIWEQLNQFTPNVMELVIYKIGTYVLSFSTLDNISRSICVGYIIIIKQLTKSNSVCVPIDRKYCYSLLRNLHTRFFVYLNTWIIISPNRVNKLCKTFVTFQSREFHLRSLVETRCATTEKPELLCCGSVVLHSDSDTTLKSSLQSMHLDVRVFG